MPKTNALALGVAALAAFLEVGCDFARFTNVAVGADGFGLISYNDGSKGLLKVAHCKGAVCASATRSVVDREVDASSAIAMGRDGRGLISYGAHTEPGPEGAVVRVAHCENVACTRARVSVIDDEFPQSIAMAIGKDGRGLITYRDAGGRLFVAHCEDTACARATVTLIDGDTGTPRNGGPSIAIGKDGRGLIAYGNSDRGLLQVAHCKDAACKNVTRHTIDSGLGPGLNVGAHPAIGIGRDGLGLIAYADENAGGNLRVAHCADQACSRADLVTTLDIETASNISLAIGSDGLGLISFKAESPSLVGSLMVAHCQDSKCQSSVVSTLDQGAPGSNPGTFTCTAVGRDGLGLISYQDGASPGRLKVAHCADVSCTSAAVSTLDTDSP